MKMELMRAPLIQSGDSSLAIWLYFVFKLATVLGSIFAMYLGYRLFVLGVTGEASLAIDAKDIKGQLINAAPGLFFGIGGIVSLIIVIIKGIEFNLGATD